MTRTQQASKEAAPENNMPNQRTDAHRPASLVPADYSFAVAFAYSDPSPGYEHPMARLRDLGESMSPPWSGFFHKAEGGGCDVCGANYIEGAAFRHIPTGTFIKVGNICADGLGLPIDKAAARRIHAQRMAARKDSKAAAERRANVEAFRALSDRHDLNAAISQARQAQEWQGARLALVDPDDLASAWAVPCECCAGHQDNMGDQEGPGHCRRCWPKISKGWSIVADIADRGERWGGISEAQIALVKKIALDEAQQEMVPEEKHVDAPEGRMEVQGTVVAAKFQENDWGGAYRMTVKVDTPDGCWLTWGTVPNALLRDADLDSLRGATVKFTATLTRGRDAFFAIYKRPSKAAMVA